jgi:hypothetical protein
MDQIVPASCELFGQALEKTDDPTTIAPRTYAHAKEILGPLVYGALHLAPDAQERSVYRKLVSCVRDSDVPAARVDAVMSVAAVPARFQALLAHVQNCSGGEAALAVLGGMWFGPPRAAVPRPMMHSAIRPHRVLLSSFEAAELRASLPVAERDESVGEWIRSVEPTEQLSLDMWAPQPEPKPRIAEDANSNALTLKHLAAHEICGGESDTNFALVVHSDEIANNGFRRFAIGKYRQAADSASGQLLDYAARYTERISDPHERSLERIAVVAKPDDDVAEEVLETVADNSLQSLTETAPPKYEHFLAEQRALLTRVRQLQDSDDAEIRRAGDNVFDTLRYTLDKVWKMHDFPGLAEYTEELRQADSDNEEEGVVA